MRQGTSKKTNGFAPRVVVFAAPREDALTGPAVVSSDSCPVRVLPFASSC